MKIIDVYEAGSSPSGEVVRLNLTKEDGSREWLELSPLHVGKLVSALLFASGVAAKNRHPATKLLGDPLELSSLIELTGWAATSSPGLPFVAVRMSIAPDVHIDFRAPTEWVQAMKEQLDRAALLAGSSDKPSAAH